MNLKVLQQALLYILLFPLGSLAQEKFDFYINNSGNDTYPGTSGLFPKKSIAGAAPLLKIFSTGNGIVKLGLKSGDTWEEGLVTSYPIQVNTYNDNGNQNDFAILNGSKEFGSGWLRTTASGNTFTQEIPYTGFVGYGINGIGGYSFMYVFEIDRALEKTAPFTARRMLQWVGDSVSVERTAGSFYTPPGNKNPMPVYIHTSDGSSPNANTKYRYEVCVRDWAVNSTNEGNNQFENLWVRGFGAGNGMLPGGSNSYYNRIVFGPGAAIHHLGVRSGTIDHSLFLPGPKNTGDFAVVFYDDAGLGRHCVMKNSMFLDISSPVYSHTSGGTNYGAVEMDNVVGFADSTVPGGFMYTNNTDSVILNNIYANGYKGGYYYGNAKFATINNSWFKDVSFGIGYGSNNPVVSTVNNVFIKTKGKTYVSGLVMQSNSVVKLTSSIIHLTSSMTDYWSGIIGDFVSGPGESEHSIDASGNIFICDVDPIKSINASGVNVGKGLGTSKDVWNNNVYVLLKGYRISWTAFNPDGINYTIGSFSDWQRISGQDQNSLFFDLRKDPRGLKAIFVDPDNGDYDLADTKEGRQIAALHAGMKTPLNCFLQKPTYEEAADLIRNNKLLAVNSCRNPCLQNTIRVNNTFTASALNDRQAKMQWNISEQQNIDHYELQKYTENLIYTKLATIPVGTDTSYTFIDAVQPGVSYQYRLAVIPKAGGVCYSDKRAVKINDNKAFTVYPNPSNGKFYISMNGYVGKTNLVVTNSVGQPVLSKEVLSLYSKLSLDLTGMPAGVYLLKVETSNGASVQKISIL